MSPRVAPITAALALALAALWAIWAWEQGAYFPTAFTLGGLAVLAVLAVLALAAPWNSRLRGPPLIALASLGGLAAWTALSFLWTPTRDAAIEDAQQIVVYAACFVLGLWLCLLLGRRMTFSLLPLALAGAVVATATAISLLLAGDPTRHLDGELTLELPLGYRNANGAFFMIACWAGLAAALDANLSRRARALFAGAASISLALAILSQSRGSLLAGVASLIVYMAVADDRLRAAGWFAVVVLPAALTLPWLLAPFATSAAGTDAAGPLDAAALAALLAGLLGTLAALAMLRWGRSLWVGAQARVGSQRLKRGGAIAGAAIFIVGFGLLVAGNGTPDKWIDRALGQVDRGGNPNLASEGSRFGLNAQSNRYDLWRVALDQFGDVPLKGGGAGSFGSAYLLDRDSVETPRDPHSVELLFAGELGLPGLGLFVLFAVAAVAGTLKSRKLGPRAASLTAGALTITAYWLVHASVDWFWNYPGLTAPVIALLGAACAPPTMQLHDRGGSRGRAVAAAGLVAFALTLVPPFLAHRWTERAADSWRTNLPSAYRDLSRAEDVFPQAIEPLLLEGEIASRVDDPARAVAAFSAAAELQPDNWAAQLLLGRAQSKLDVRAARGALERAALLNPGDPRARRALERINR